MESIAELRDICRRENHEDNRKTMLLAAKVSIYFTRLFLLLGLSANQVTYIFIILGIAGALAFLGPGIEWVLAGYVLHRLHVICDVCDGEVARYRKTSSPIGAYLDFLTHYAVYIVLLFSVSFRYYLDSGRTWSLIAGFILVIAITLNRAAVDCWFRANFGKSDRGEIEEGRAGQSRSTMPRRRKIALLAAAHATSIQTFLNVYLASSLIELAVDFDTRRFVIPGYAVILFAFSIVRVAVTAARGRIPRRATYY